MGQTALLYVGAVLFVNGLSLLGLVKGKSMIPMNLFVGVLQVITPTYLIFTSNGDKSIILGASGLFLFGFTYLYVAMNNAFDLDGTGLGWFCFFVFIAAGVYSYYNFRETNGAGYVFGVLWANWSFLWLLFWLVLSLGWTSYTKWTGAICAAQGLYTGMLPALILLGVDSYFTSTLAIIIGIVAVATDVLFFVVFNPTKYAEPATEVSAAY